MAANAMSSDFLPWGALLSASHFDPFLFFAPDQRACGFSIKLASNFGVQNVAGQSSWNWVQAYS